MKTAQTVQTVDTSLKKARCYISLSASELAKFTALSESLGMSKTKIVRLMVLENSSIMLCNTVELIKTLDFLGRQIAEMNSRLAPVLPPFASARVQAKLPFNKPSYSLSSLDAYLTKLQAIEDAFRELLKITKKMK